MSMKTVTLVAVPSPVRPAPRLTLVQRFRTRLREACRARAERVRERRSARLTADALAHLGPRELRDIGVVRLDDVRPPRYVRFDGLA